MIAKLIQHLRLQRRPEAGNKEAGDYFKQAVSWSDDYYLVTLSSRNRYRCAFITTLLLCACLAMCITVLVPSQHIQPFLVHYYASGAISVDSVKIKDLPLSQAQTESELIRYVINRETYDHYSYAKQYALTYLLSSHLVASQYKKEQGANNPHSFIALFGSKYRRTIHVESVIFLDDIQLTTGNNQHTNLAEINFSENINNINSGKSSVKSFVATLSWEYGKIPSDPEKRWKNWSGFQVINYHISQRSL